MDIGECRGVVGGIGSYPADSVWPIGLIRKRCGTGWISPGVGTAFKWGIEQGARKKCKAI
jgi:hypothetical protein